jgi:hypothetical protein
MKELTRSTKAGLMVTVSAAALSAGAALWLRARARRAARPGQQHGSNIAIPASFDAASLTRKFLLYYVIPVWMAAGIADWVCHRATDIAHTTGAKESLMHLLMLTEAAVPVLAGFFLEITAPVAALMITVFFLHEATALWDVGYAVTARNVTPIEQHVHSFLEMVPLMAISFIAVLHWPQFRALLVPGEEPPDLSLRWKEKPLPPRYVPTALGAMAVFEWLPYLEELYRTLRASNGRLVPAAVRR